jgi:4-hydroxy-tetrahydrodipicolinate reductase
MATQTVDIVVCGAAGRMGRRIIALAAADPRARVVGAVEAARNASLGADAGELAGVGALGVAVTEDLSALARPDAVIIDFTYADVTPHHVGIAAEAGAPIVVGTTGLSKEQRSEVERLAARMPTLFAPNMSLGVNVLLSLVEDAVRRMGDGFDCEIVELHHNRKKDAPSGTALALAEAAARASGRDPEHDLVLSRAGMTGERNKQEIGVLALRGGDAVGEHTVMLIGTGERLELTHRATSRDCLASGAVRGALWLADRPAGLYSMRDVIAQSGD